MWLRAWLTISLIVSAGAMIVFAGFLLVSAFPLFQQFGLTPIIGTEWYPYEREFGLLAAIVGSLWSIAIALAIATPCGLATAIVSLELLPRGATGPVNLIIDTLAGIPSVVYGLLGLALLLPWIEDHLGLISGHSLFAAGILLSVMITPTIIRLSQDALRDIDPCYREAALSLGLNWSQRLWSVLLPQAWPGMRSAILLATGRGLGETIAVMLVVGSIDRLPDPWYNILAPAQTITSRIGREMGEAAYGSMQWSALMASAIILTLVVIMLGALAQRPSFIKIATTHG